MDRKRYLAIITVRYLRNDPNFCIWYDEAECDGECLANDIIAEWDLTADELRESR
jgi:hypothetical protein